MDDILHYAPLLVIAMLIGAGIQMNRLERRSETLLKMVQDILNNRR